MTETTTSSETYNDPLVSQIQQTEAEQNVVSYQPPVSVFNPSSETEPMSTNFAADDAFNKSLFTHGTSDFQTTYAKNIETGTVFDEVSTLFKDSSVAAMVEDFIFKPDYTMKEKKDYVFHMYNKHASWRELTPWTAFLYTLFSQPYLEDASGNKIPTETIPIEKARILYRQLTPEQVNAFVFNIRFQLTQQARDISNDFIANKGWADGSPIETFADMGLDVLIQDFTPFANIISRVGLAKEMAALSDTKINWYNILPGSIGAAIRENLVAMSPQEQRDTIEYMSKELNKALKSPTYGPAMTRYNLVEQWSSVFNDEVLMQGDPKDTVDEWARNIEAVLDGFLYSFILAKMALKTSIKGLMYIGDHVEALKVARHSHNGEAVQALTQMLKNDDVAGKFGIEIEDTVFAGIVKPKVKEIVDSIPFLPEDFREVATHHKKELYKLANDATVRVQMQLTDSSIKKAILDRLKIVEEASSYGSVWSKMSTIKLNELGGGVEITATIGKTDTKPFDSLSEAAEVALELDPGLDYFTIAKLNDAGVLEPLTLNSKQLNDYLKGTVKPQMISGMNPSTSKVTQPKYFLQYIDNRPWNPIDAHMFTPDSISQSMFRFLFTPNYKFGSEFFNPFSLGYKDQQRAARLLKELAEPWDALKPADKQLVQSMFETAEEWGKANNQVIPIEELATRFGLDATSDQIVGFVALRNMYDTMNEMLQIRIYNEWKAANYKTARPLNKEMASYSGKVFPDGEAPVGKAKSKLPNDKNQYKLEALDPETFTLVPLDKTFVDDLYANGGKIMEVEIPIELGKKATKSSSYIILKPEVYRIGDLTRAPLHYQAGYSFRFYDDPYFIFRTTTTLVNGIPTLSKRAYMTAATSRSADRAVRELQNNLADGTYTKERANDLAQVDSDLYQKQVFQMEGRLFYDSRMRDRLTDTTGNLASIEDPALAIERGIQLLAREISNTNPLAAAKRAWMGTYGEKAKQILRRDVDLEKEPLNTLQSALKEETKNLVGLDRTNMLDAIEYIKYFRLTEGTMGGWATTGLRSGLTRLAESMESKSGGTYNRAPWRGVQKWAQTTQPIRTAKSTAFTMFMRLRPFRQFILQSAQPLFLAAIDPAYFATGRIINDTMALLQGATIVRRGQQAIPIKTKALAASMGMSTKEFLFLSKQFDRSGLTDLVDLVDYTGKVVKKSAKATRLPTEGSFISKASYYTKRVFTNAADMAGSGFRLGETNNLAATYMLAIRRYMKSKNIKSVLEIDPKAFDHIRVDASNLALAMIKPNNMVYQTGLFGLTTQFLSFQHKALLALFMKNPAITKSQALKMWATGTLLYGGDFIGHAAFVSAVLRDSGLDWANHTIIPDTEYTVADLITEGLIQSSINQIGNTLSEDWIDLDFKSFSPGPDAERMELLITGVFDDPLGKVLGPAGSIMGSLSESIGLAQTMASGYQGMPPLEAFIGMADVVVAGLIPQYSDIQRALLMAKFQREFTKLGEPLELESTFNTVMARLFVGVGTEQYTAYRHINEKIYEDAKEYSDLVNRTSDHINIILDRHYGGELSYKRASDALRFVVDVWDEIPYGRRAEFERAIYNRTGPRREQSILQRTAEHGAKNQLTSEMKYHIRKLSDSFNEAEIERLLFMAEDAWGGAKERDDVLYWKMRED
tara:strand:- start:1045 stop:6000 length:4956 start_codon:yes stop_codon:yes gene_type:complete